MFDSLTLGIIAIVFAVTFLVTLFVTPTIGKAMKQHGITGRDVHKLSKTEVPEMCGLAILLGLTAGMFSYAVIAPDASREAVAFIATVLIAGAIGIVDDLHPLGARTKPLLTAVACAPILLLGTYNPFPVIPLVGRLRLTLVYPLLIPVAIAVTSNAVNMMDVMNGSMPGTASVIAVAVFVILLASGQVKATVLSIALVGALLAFYYYNRYPARVFGGDTGSLAVGAGLGALSIIGRVETVMVIALIPQIMNAFYGLASVGRLYERRQIRQRPIMLLDDGKLKASTERGAPVTLTRLILAAGPLTEREIVRGMIMLTVVSSILALVTYWLTVSVHL
jgi:UDP-N-acetylglucosamine--dolichyl-phosphate N-acetylglucosaminephosphotransferase